MRAGGSTTAATVRERKMQIRFMVPCAVQCDRCGEIIPPHRKFNGHKDLLDEKYLDTVKIYTLTFHCPQCHALLVLQTDPANADYIMKSGCHRLFEKSREEEKKKEKDDEKDIPIDKTTELESRLEKLQNQQLQIDELTNLQQLQSQIHKKELNHNTKSGSGSDEIKNDTAVSLENSTFANLKKQFETKSNKLNKENNNTSNLIKLRTTKNKGKSASSSLSSSLGIVIKNKKRKNKVNIRKITKK